MNRQKIILAVLLFVFAGTVAYSILGGPKQKREEKLKYTTGMNANAYMAAKGGEDATRLRIDLLDRENQRFSGFRRNIFKPVFTSSINVPLKPLKPLKPLPPAPPLPPPPPVEKTPAQVAMEEVGKFYFLGYLQKENRKTVFLTRDNQIFLVRKGEKILGKYDVADVTDNMLTIAIPPAGEQVVIPLTQNRPLGRR